MNASSIYWINQVNCEYMVSSLLLSSLIGLTTRGRRLTRSQVFRSTISKVYSNPTSLGLNRERRVSQRTTSLRFRRLHVVFGQRVIRSNPITGTGLFLAEESAHLLAKGAVAWVNVEVFGHFASHRYSSSVCMDLFTNTTRHETCWIG